ncbi:MAG TPA: hypothetical protein VLK25_07665 [Allosphingosinicella sp.]|nr:hypothetical protein [Allosphingosinicella sp.]
MSDFDLDRLGDVWRQQPDPAELEALRRSAEAVRRRARWSQLIEVAAALVVAGLVVVLALSNPERDILVAGGAAIVILLYSLIRQRRLREAELHGLTGSAEEMIDQSIFRVEATLKRAKFGAVMMPAGLIFGLSFGYLIDRGSAGRPMTWYHGQPGLAAIVLALACASLGIATILLFRSMRKSRQELERLTGLREAYRKEGEQIS